METSVSISICSSIRSSSDICYVYTICTYIYIYYIYDMSCKNKCLLKKVATTVCWDIYIYIFDKSDGVLNFFKIFSWVLNFLTFRKILTNPSIRY